MSFYQIYNENINDLLKTGSGVNTNLKVRQDRHGKFFVQNLTQKQVYKPKDVFKLMKQAQQNRTAHATGMNELSSRSHLIL